MTRHLTLVVFCAISLFLSANVKAETDKSLSYYTFSHIETHLYDTDALLQAINTLNQAAILDMNEPWGYIASTFETLSNGYRGGNRYDVSSYRIGQVALAEKFARNAVELDPDTAMSHVALSLVEIIQGKMDSAWQRLDTAYQLEPENFYPWYYRGVIATQKQETTSAKKYFRGAMQRTTFQPHKSWVVSQMHIVTHTEQDNARRLAANSH